MILANRVQYRMAHRPSACCPLSSSFVNGESVFRGPCVIVEPSLAGPGLQVEMLKTQ